MTADRPRIVIATSSAGHGPATAARNLGSALLEARRDGVEVSILDLPRSMGGLADLTVNRMYNFSLRHGLAWNRVGVSLSFRLDWGRIGRFVSRSRASTGGIPGPAPDAVAFTTPWLVEPTLAGLGDGCPTHSVVLDLGPPLSPGWGCAGMDHVHAPTEDARRALGARAALTGAPVFPPEAGAAPPVHCGGCEGAPSLLVMGGAGGYGGMPRIANAIARRPDVHVTILAGRDERLLRVLQGIASRARAHVVVAPFVPDVAPVIAGHDAVLTKPGTLTIAEALAHGKPLLLDASRGVMPQEIGNVRFVEGHRAGVAFDSPAQVPAALDAIMGGGYRDAARSLQGIAGADRIAAEILRGL